MASRVEALSMSSRVARALREEGWSGELVAVHARSCYVMDEDSEIYAVVDEAAGNGPLNLVVGGALPGALQHLSVGETVKSTGSLLMLSDSLDIGLANAALWNATPPALPPDQDALRLTLATVFDTASGEAPATSLARLLPYLDEEDLPDELQRVDHFPRSHALMCGLAESLARRNRRSLKVVTSSLAGFGPGLTPAGDDFLAGVLLALALRQEPHPDPELHEIAGLVLDTAAPRTGEISAAYLKAARAGEAGERWHRLLAALRSGAGEALPAAARAVMQTGETSGGDMLAGFLTALRALQRVAAID
jgi:hypothetical protein